jgi:hypothetical protein
MEQTKQKNQYKYQLKLIFGGIRIYFFIVFVFFVYITNRFSFRTIRLRIDLFRILFEAHVFENSSSILRHFHVGVASYCRNEIRNYLQVLNDNSIMMRL